MHDTTPSISARGRSQTRTGAHTGCTRSAGMSSHVSLLRIPFQDVARSLRKGHSVLYGRSFVGNESKQVFPWEYDKFPRENFPTGNSTNADQSPVAHVDIYDARNIATLSGLTSHRQRRKQKKHEELRTRPQPSVDRALHCFFLNFGVFGTTTNSLSGVVSVVFVQLGPTVTSPRKQRAAADREQDRSDVSAKGAPCKWMFRDRSTKIAVTSPFLVGGRTFLTVANRTKPWAKARENLNTKLWLSLVSTIKSNMKRAFLRSLRRIVFQEKIVKSILNHE
ncbi:hypothetical protein EVAR_78890_1 [Eumeta japonica]|uniref:Uncharacterized protein n=1 Tax=Eumeta variegata TaxID=151549 RepID=A0A4C1U2B5_EUMVA|nr:hypothetical protein EVAR_78890_1 [Eumeta japonica]